MERIKNSNGDYVVRGIGTDVRDGGDTGRPPSLLYYCGKAKGVCWCANRACGVVCGPHSGCPCNACLQLSCEYVPQPQQGQQVTGSAAAVPVIVSHHHPIPAHVAEGRGEFNGHRGLQKNDKVVPYPPVPLPLPPPHSPQDVELNRRGGRHPVSQEEVRVVDVIDLVPSPDNDATIIERGIAEVHVGNAPAPAPTAPLLVEADVFTNGVGVPCRRGKPGLVGGSTRMDAGQVFYCGKVGVVCPCDDRDCDGICGPEAGCPCNPCLELTLLFIANEENEDKGRPTNNNNRLVTPPPMKDEDCIICMERRKSHALIPCGHYSYCAECVQGR